MKLTIARRIVGLTLVLAAAMTAVAAAGGWSMKRGSDAAAGFIDHEFALQHGLGELHVALLQARRHEKDLMIGMNDAATVQAEIKAWNEARARAGRLLAVLGAKVQAAEHKQAIAKAAGHLDAYAASFQSVAKRVEAEAFDNPSAAATLMKRVEADFQQVERVVLGASAVLNERSVELRERLADERRSALALFAAVALAAVAVALLAGLHTARSIVRPLRQAVRAAREVAAGDLSASIASERRADELGELQAAQAEMLRQLRRIIGEVRAAGGQIGTASSEIALGNGDLSGRTEQQAASLQQTASSMQQLAVTVGSNAESARQANQLALSACEVAQRGGAVVGQVVTTMGEISEGSRKIADIIGVIDGIAFQTNILALNAAVEAARAGEAGRGFAVVAGEVRGLAQQSADAARQIKALIEASVSKVESGSRLVRDAGGTMREIVASVQRVTDIIGEISAATGEQTGEIGQVNAAMGALDRMTQQNAALVEQSAAAAESLKDQAMRLTATIDAFRLDAAAPTRAAAAPGPARPRASRPVQAGAARASAPRPERAAADAAPAGGNHDWQAF